MRTYLVIVLAMLIATTAVGATTLNVSTSLHSPSVNITYSPFYISGQPVVSQLILKNQNNFTEHVK